MIITLTGTNNFLIDNELAKLANEFEASNGNLAIERFEADESEFQRIYDSFNNLPFLSAKKLIIIKKPASNKDFLAQIDSLINNLPDSNEVIIVETDLDKRSNFYKLLKQKTDYREFNEPSVNELAAWVAEQARIKQGRISIADANYLINVAGTSQIKLSNELSKLLTYDHSVTRQSIDLLVDPIPQTTIFQLLDAVFGGNAEKAIKIYEDQRRQKVEPQQIIAMLAWQLHILALIKSAVGKSPNEIARQAGINPFVVSKSTSIEKKLSLSDLKKIIDLVIEIDVELKNRMIDIDEAMKYLLLSIADLKARD